MARGNTLAAHQPPIAARQDVTDLDTLTSMSQESADPPDNDVRQTQHNQFGYENVVIKGLSEVDEGSGYRLALVKIFYYSGVTSAIKLQQKLFRLTCIIICRQYRKKNHKAKLLWPIIAHALHS